MNTRSRTRCPPGTRSLLQAVRQRLPADPPRLRRGFAAANCSRRVALADLQPDTFYQFDEVTARAFSDAVIEWASQRPGGRLVLVCPDPGEVYGLEHRLQHLAARFDQTLVLGCEAPRAAAAQATRVEIRSFARTLLGRYRLALRSGRRSVAFVAREIGGARPNRIGFFTLDPDTIGDLDEDVDQVCHDRHADLASFRARESRARRAATRRSRKR